MYLSQLLIDVGSNPDRPRPGRRWLDNVYLVHQRLCMAFPSQNRRSDDPRFLQPFNPDHFRGSPTSTREPFLFRIDNAVMLNSPRAIVLVQSLSEPDWEYAFQNLGNNFFAAPPEQKEYEPSFTIGQQLRFRVQINLSKKNSKFDNDNIERPEKVRRKRVSLIWGDVDRDEKIRAWFSEKSTKKGFDVSSLSVMNVGWVSGFKPKTITRNTEFKMKFRSALLEGTLVVRDADLFKQAIEHGIGAAKAFGFGLLTVAPMNT